MEWSVLRTFLSGAKPPPAAALLRAVVNSQAEARMFVVYFAMLRLNRNTGRAWMAIERACHLTKKPHWLYLVEGGICHILCYEAISCSIFG